MIDTMSRIHGGSVKGVLNQLMFMVHVEMMELFFFSVSISIVVSCCFFCHLKHVLVCLSVCFYEATLFL